MKIFYVLLTISLCLIQLTCIGAIRIQGIVTNAATDKLTCTIISNDLSKQFVKVAIPLQEGKFMHRFDLTGTTFLSFSDGSNYFGGFVQAGDSIMIQYDQLNFDKSIAYSGIGKEKFEIGYGINQIKGLPKKYAAAASSERYPTDNLFGKIDSAEVLLAGQIAKTAEKMSPESNMQLSAYLAANILHAKYNGLVAIFGDSYDAILEKHQARLSAQSIKQIRELLMFDEKFYRSKFYVSTAEVIMSIYLEENIQLHTSDFAERKYHYLLAKLPAKLRSPVLFTMLNSDINNSGGTIENSVFLQATELLDDIGLKQHIAGKLTGLEAIRVGGKAPDFSLINQSGQKINLTSFTGKTIYLDFWFAGCRPCHMLFKAIEPVKDYFKADSSVVFLTVSVDTEKEWKKAITKFDVKGYHAFTENKFRDHPMIKSYQVGGYPTSYIINPNGEFHSVHPSANPEILKQQILESVDVKRK